MKAALYAMLFAGTAFFVSMLYGVCNAAELGWHVRTITDHPWPQEEALCDAIAQRLNTRTNRVIEDNQREMRNEESAWAGYVAPVISEENHYSIQLLFIQRNDMGGIRYSVIPDVRSYRVKDGKSGYFIVRNDPVVSGAYEYEDQLIIAPDENNREVDYGNLMPGQMICGGDEKEYESMPLCRSAFVLPVVNGIRDMNQLLNGNKHYKDALPPLQYDNRKYWLYEEGIAAWPETFPDSYLSASMKGQPLPVAVIAVTDRRFWQDSPDHPSLLSKGIAPRIVLLELFHTANAKDKDGQAFPLDPVKSCILENRIR